MKKIISAVLCLALFLSLLVNERIIAGASEGAIVKNGGFEEGFAYWNAAEQNCWAASDEQAASGKNSVKQTGQTWLYQKISLKAGMTYKLSFKVYGNTRWLNYGIGDKFYSCNVIKSHIVRYSDSWYSAEEYFTIETAGDYYVGFYDEDEVPTYIDDISIEEVEAAEEAIVKNGDFEQGFNHWSASELNCWAVSDEQAASGEKSVKQTGQTWLYQKISLDAGKTYKLSFKIYGSTRWLNYGIGKSHNSCNIIKNHIVRYSDAWYLVEEFFSITESGGYYVSFYDEDTVATYIDDIVIEEVESDDDIIVKNGDFEQGFNHWNASELNCWAVSDEQAASGKKSVKQTGQTWLYQQISLESGKTYKLSFKIYGSTRWLNYGIGDKSYSCSVFKNHIVRNADSWYTVEEYFSVAQTGSYYVSFFDEDNAPTYVDDVVIESDDKEEKSFISNGGFEDGFKSWGAAEENRWTVTDELAASGEKSVKQTGMTWMYQGVSLKKDKTYRLSFKIYGTVTELSYGIGTSSTNCAVFKRTVSKDEKAWSEVEEYFTVPSKGRYFVSFYDAYEAESYLDDIAITETDPFTGNVGEVWSGKTATAYMDGTGTENDPYIIATGEQLYKMVTDAEVNSGTEKWFALSENIKLNDVNSGDWAKKADDEYEGTLKLNNWAYIAADSDAQAFAGHFDGRGHIIEGLYVLAKGYGARVGLFPCVDVGSTVKNVGITNSYIDLSHEYNYSYASAFIGYVKYREDISFEEKVAKAPVVSECFADSSVYLKGAFVGGFVGGTPSPITFRNCYFTGSIDACTGRHGAIIGNMWSEGIKIENCIGATQTMDPFTYNTPSIKDSYFFGSGSVKGLTLVLIDDMLGENAKTSMPALDYNNIWQTVNGGTPVLRVFGEDAYKYTDKADRKVTVNFVSNVNGLDIEPITGRAGTKISLPVISRENYTFDGWYVYKELQCKYPDDTFPYVGLTLYAKWSRAFDVEQNFESYPNTEYDIDTDYVWYRPGIKGYNSEYVHGGAKSIHRIGNSANAQDFLAAYEQMLTVGKKYRISFWVRTDSTDASVPISLVHNTWPDIAEPIKKVEKITDLKITAANGWQKVEFSFTAETRWVSIRSGGGASLYFDDIIII